MCFEFVKMQVITFKPYKMVLMLIRTKDSDGKCHCIFGVLNVSLEFSPTVIHYSKISNVLVVVASQDIGMSLLLFFFFAKCQRTDSKFEWKDRRVSRLCLLSCTLKCWSNFCCWVILFNRLSCELPTNNSAMLLY